MLLRSKKKTEKGETLYDRKAQDALTQRQIKEIYGIPQRVFVKMLKDPSFPQRSKYLHGYRRSEVEAFLEKNL